MTGLKAWQRAIVLLLISLFWLGSRAAETRTQGDTLFVRLANPGEEVREIRLSGADLLGQ